MSKIICIGDVHIKDHLSYSNHIEDKREGEKKEIIDFILRSSEDCDHIVFMGDFFNSKNNSSEANRFATEFIESFGDKDIYIISGNHEKKGDGSTAIDYLAEVRKPNWHIMTHQTSIDLDGLKIDFLPYILNSEIGAETTEIATQMILDNLDGGDIIFAHHCISGTTFHGVKTEDLSEVVLDQKKLAEKYKLIVAGHIHSPQQYENVLITGSLFTSEVGETEKFIWKIESDDMSIEKIKVPAREIHKITDPSNQNLSSIPDSSIVKVIVTKKTAYIEKIKELLSRFDAYLLIEDYPSERKRAHIEEGAFDFEIESLLKLYAEAKSVDYEKLLKGLQIIK